MWFIYKKSILCKGILTILLLVSTVASSTTTSDSEVTGDKRKQMLALSTSTTVAQASNTKQAKKEAKTKEEKKAEREAKKAARKEAKAKEKAEEEAMAAEYLRQQKEAENVTYYYAEPKKDLTTPEERKRVLGNMRKRLDAKEELEKSESDRAKELKEQTKLAEKASGLAIERAQKEEELFRKNLEEYQRQKKLKSLETALGLDSTTATSNSDSDKPASALDELIRKNRELEAQFNKSK